MSYFLIYIGIGVFVFGGVYGYYEEFVRDYKRKNSGEFLWWFHILIPGFVILAWPFVLGSRLM